MIVAKSDYRKLALFIRVLTRAADPCNKKRRTRRHGVFASVEGSYLSSKDGAPASRRAPAPLPALAAAALVNSGPYFSNRTGTNAPSASLVKVILPSGPM